MAGYIGSKASVTQVDGYNQAEADAEFVNDPNGAITVDGSNNVGIGASSPAQKLHISGNQLFDNNDEIRFKDGGGSQRTAITLSSNDLNIGTSAGGNLKFYNGSSYTERMRIDSSGNVGIGTSSPDDVLHVVTPSFGGITLECTGATADPTFKFLGDSGNYWSLQQDASQGDSFQFRYNNSEQIRIDGSGNLLVGTTDEGIYGSSSAAGISLRGSIGLLGASRNSNESGNFNRYGTDGDIVKFRKDGSTMGSIGSRSAGSSKVLYIGFSGSSSDVGLTGTTTSAHAIIPCENGSSADNIVDLGVSSVRFDDIYATNGTIQTSDRNEKQDIEVLSDAEQRVAVACKGLLRKFRWIDSVAEKGDTARIHFGIIAQDLQDAFTAEGLDAGRYAMFISSTWWETQTDVPAVAAVAEVLDDDGNVVTEAVEAKDAYTRTDTYETLEEAPEGATERTRLGVRYPELLAFIIGAM